MLALRYIALLCRLDEARSVIVRNWVEVLRLSGCHRFLFPESSDWFNWRLRAIMGSTSVKTKRRKKKKEKKNGPEPRFELGASCNQELCSR